jgi:hypothetical protein
MHLVHFKKDYAQLVFDAIKGRKPIPPPPEGWTGSAMLQAAGILSAGVQSQGPHSLAALGKTVKDLDGLHLEHREAVDQTHVKDVGLAIEFASVAGFHVLDKTYDEHFGPEFMAIVYATADGGQALTAVRGFKGSPGDPLKDDAKPAA